MKSLICGILLVFIHLEFNCQETNWKHEINPFYKISNNAINSVNGMNAIIQLASIFTTYGIISTKLDYKIHNYFYENKDQYNASSIPAVYVGYLVPISLGGSLYAVGLWKDNPKISSSRMCSITGFFPCMDRNQFA